MQYVLSLVCMVQRKLKDENYIQRFLTLSKKQSEKLYMVFNKLFSRIILSKEFRPESIRLALDNVSLATGLFQILVCSLYASSLVDVCRILFIMKKVHVCDD